MNESKNDNGLLQRCIRAIKKEVPDFLVIGDIAMDPYSTQGHDGYVTLSLHSLDSNELT